MMRYAAMATPEYPRTSVLWRGIILRSIVNAIMVAEDADYARFLSWDGKDYVLNNLDGTYGAITFDGDYVVGVFFDAHSKNNPYLLNEKYEINRFFQGMPAPLHSLAKNQTLRYNRQTYQGKTVSLITAAFWNDGEYLTAAFPWEDVFLNGAHIIGIELLDDTEAALKEWQDAYQCSSEQLAFARSLFERRMSKPSTSIVLSESEVEWLVTVSENSEAFTDCLRALGPIGIIVPR
jgi:hypothetical protein